MTEEIWRDIENYEGLYQVSNLGNIKSLTHKHPIRNQIIVGCMLNPSKLPSGHLIVGLNKTGKGVTKIVHRLVAKAFPEICGEWFNECEVHHKDHNPANNRADNLMILDKETHRIYHQNSELSKIKRSEAPHFSKLVFQYDYNWNFLTSYTSTIEAADAISGDVASLRAAAKDTNHNGTHFYKGYRWLYGN